MLQSMSQCEPQCLSVKLVSNDVFQYSYSNIDDYIERDIFQVIFCTFIDQPSSRVLTYSTAASTGASYN